MRRIAFKFVFSVCILVACLSAAASASAAPAINGTFPVASEIDANNKIVAGPDGNVWLTVGGGNDVARVTPGGEVQEFDLPGISGTNGIAAGPDGNLWVPTINAVTKFAPGDPVGSAQTFTVNTINNGGQVITGPDGLLWVASQNSVVHFSAANPEGAQAVSLEGELAPKDIEVAGSLVVVADQSGGNRVVTFTTAGTQKDFATDGPSQGVAGGPNGQIAFTAPLAVPEKAGLISPPNPAQSFELLGDPFGVAFGGDGAYWIVQFAFGQLARVTTDGQLTTPITGLPLESARQITAGPGGTLWVTLTKNEVKGVEPAVVRISGVEPPPAPAPSGGGAPNDGGNPPPPPAPETTLAKGKKLFKTKGKRAKVKFRFSSSTTGAAFECALRKKRKGKLTPIKYKACKPPKIYKLAPGRYLFLVRAVKDGVIDGSPAARSFRVDHVH
ncbi:MAG: Vgb family protein [Solirubrobacterales bacterium]